MKYISASDEARDLRKAKSPSRMANAVEEGLHYMGALFPKTRTPVCMERRTQQPRIWNCDTKSVRSRRFWKKERCPSRPRSPSRSHSRSPSRSPSRLPSPPRRIYTPHRSTKEKGKEEAAKTKCKHCKKAGRTAPHPANTLITGMKLSWSNVTISRLCL